MSEWQPIDTAPRNRVRVLLCSSDEVVVVAFHNGKEWIVGWDNSPFEGEAGGYDATHWMPLPSPPTDLPSQSI